MAASKKCRFLLYILTQLEKTLFWAPPPNPPTHLNPWMTLKKWVPLFFQGPDHPDIGTVLFNLASLLREVQGLGYEEACEQLLRRALAIKQNALAPDHPEILPIMVSLAKVLSSKEEGSGFEEAESLLRRAVEIQVVTQLFYEVLCGFGEFELSGYKYT